MPRGIYDRSKEEKQGVTSQPQVTVTPPKVAARVRRYSDNRDHKGEGEPLCLNCTHRQDMHHLWNYHEGTVIGKNLQGDILQVEKKWKTVRVDEGNRPCQHACLCKNYE